ncbi:uncharacterized protein HMPREF1541_06277 [Cyphellophora europaea CBS 101466]|uniref:Uncharacterized protein n=1 Tax=Cyphellophora europaea (strain CBS 101466) TaxID=1220924 RepID=W2RNY5_CYPE1|nr:uncharacterized protein HMPREF1541_06277 [Cyphellophora europaea CBS 101466]ETN38246.1 hypothetical protein HMPREF1541_06277 [Cyphellophora europaea CBS 101466]
MGEDEDGNIDYRDYDAVLDGKQLPVRTLFDVLGWILSVTAKPDGGKATQNNFYLPLLALFGKWCWALLPDKTSQPNMIHISWMEKPEVEENVVIIGATPGGDECYWSGEKEVYHEKEPQTEESRKKLKSIPSNEKINWSYEGHRGKDVVGSRQQMLRDLRVPVPPGDEENLVQVGKKDPAHKNKLLTHVNRDGELVDDTDETAYTVGSSAYGVCAETFSYIWMGQHMRDHDIPLINGFALDTTKVDLADMTTFDPAKLENAFREPCRNSCQKIMPHFKGKFLFKLERMEPLSNGTQPVEKKVNSRKKAKAKAKAKKSEKDNDDEQSGDGL